MSVTAFFSMGWIDCGQDLGASPQSAALLLMVRLRRVLLGLNHIESVNVLAVHMPTPQ